MSDKIDIKPGMLIRHRCGIITWACENNGKITLVGENEVLSVDWFKYNKYAWTFKINPQHGDSGLDIIKIYKYWYDEPIPHSMSKVLKMGNTGLAIMLMNDYNLTHRFY